MPNSFAKYTEISLNALEFSPKKQEIIGKKKEVINKVADYHRTKPTSILFYGFNPAILSLSGIKLSITHYNETIKKYLEYMNVDINFIPSEQLSNFHKKFDWVVAPDEYFTFALSEEYQRKEIELATSLATSKIVTTLRDYKNQEHKEKEFSQPIAIYNNHVPKIFLEHHSYSFEDRDAWTTNVHEISDSVTLVHNFFVRRSLYFKQLAKFSIDGGANAFYVHKNLMYKSLIKKNYEHVISLSL